MHVHTLTQLNAAELAEAVRAAEVSCRKKGQKLTPLRQRVLELLLQNGGPAKAYDLLARINDDGTAKPPTVYRALEFLIDTGLAHRIESLNAYVACTHHGHASASLFLLCRCCGRTEEQHATALEAIVQQSASTLGFAVEQSVIEVRGLCRECQA
jgi:Fur family zinc uptake transcriptional regulator